ncbi:MAG: hypothetical protein AAGI15_10310 [Pseudomonadota bacterium]
MSRFQAFAIHLAISLVIFAALAALVVYLWYPGFFFETDGGWQGIRIIVLVDLVLGPLLTLVVYKAGKKGLAMDLTLIAAFQGICLLAGTWIVYSERPLALVFADGQFNAVTADTYRGAGMPVPDFSDYPGASPKWVMVQLPPDPIEQSRIRRELMESEQSTVLLQQYYQPFDAQARDFTEESTAFKYVQEDDFENRGIADFSSEQGRAATAFKFYPYAARYQYFYLAFDREAHRFAGALTPYLPTDEERARFEQARRASAGDRGASSG